MATRDRPVRREGGSLLVIPRPRWFSEEVLVFEVACGAGVRLKFLVLEEQGESGRGALGSEGSVRLKPDWRTADGKPPSAGSGEPRMEEPPRAPERREAERSSQPVDTDRIRARREHRDDGRRRAGRQERLQGRRRGTRDAQRDHLTHKGRDARSRIKNPKEMRRQREGLRSLERELREVGTGGKER